MASIQNIPILDKTKITDTETRTNIRTALRSEVETWLTHYGIPYEVYIDEGIPDDWEHGHSLHGRWMFDHTTVIVTKLNSAYLTEVYEALADIPTEDICTAFGIDDLVCKPFEDCHTARAIF